jgi:hypothetical protein
MGYNLQRDAGELPRSPLPPEPHDAFADRAATMSIRRSPRHTG